MFNLVGKELRNCPRCGKVFVYVGKSICPDCIRLEEEEYDRVRAFLKEHPGASLETTAEETGVEEEVILRFLREGRLEATQGFSNVLACQICGRPISSGRICAQCSQQLSRLAKQRKESQGREVIHIADRLKKKE